MNFILYSEKPTADCVKALSERIHQAETATRPGLDGYVQKNGQFRLGLTSRVYDRIPHKTWMEGKIAKEGGVTVIRGQVPDGAPPDRQRWIVGLMPVAGLLLLLRGEALLAFLAVVGIGYVLVILRGNYFNGDRLLVEIEKTLKASPKPPKTAAPPTGGKASGARKA